MDLETNEEEVKQGQIFRSLVFLIDFTYLGPIFEHGSKTSFAQDPNLRLNVESAKFVEALISDSWGAGFKNEDNIKPGHRNIYLNGGEHHPYCKPIALHSTLSVNQMNIKKT